MVAFTGYLYGRWLIKKERRYERSMFEIDDNRIFLTRGDTCVIGITLTNMDGTAYEPKPDDVIIFRMKRNATKAPTEMLIEKEADIVDGEITVGIGPSDTVELAFGEYHYEVELVTGDEGSEHYTVIADQTFEIGKELENHGE